MNLSYISFFVLLINFFICYAFYFLTCKAHTVFERYCTNEIYQIITIIIIIIIISIIISFSIKYS